MQRMAGTSDGTAIRQFEIDGSRIFDGKPFLGTASGTDALMVSLQAVGIRPGREVIVPAFGCTALASSALWLGATVKFVDISQEDFALDSKQLEKAITPKTGAIIFAHLFVPSTGVLSAREISHKYNIPLIEDIAQVFGGNVVSTDTCFLVGTVGDLSCCSFSTSKPLETIGNAGAIIVNRLDLEETVRLLSSYGSKERFLDYPVAGINARLDGLHAAILRSRLQSYKKTLRHKNKIVAIYQQELGGIPELQLPNQNLESIFRFRFPILVANRDKFLAYLCKKFEKKRQLIPLTSYAIPLPELTAFRPETESIYPVAQDIGKRILTLSLEDNLTISDAHELCLAIREFYK